VAAPSQMPPPGAGPSRYPMPLPGQPETSAVAPQPYSTKMGDITDELDL
jgi:hypothetical protein